MQSKNARLVFVSLVVAFALVTATILLLSEFVQDVRAEPVNLFVTPGGGGDCSQANPCDLQTGLSSSLPGDRIYFAQGTYTGVGGAVITTTQDLHFYGGWDGAASGEIHRDPDTYPSILDGEGQRRAFYLDGSTDAITTTIDGLTITGGDASQVVEATGYGGGIYGIDARATITNNHITENIAGTSTGSVPTYGGGVYLEDVESGVRIHNNIIYSNTANLDGRGFGGGIVLREVQGALFTGNHVLTNTAVITGGRAYGGGIALLYADGAVIEDNTFAGNIAYQGDVWEISDGGGLFISFSNDVMLRNNDIRDNVTHSNVYGGTGGGLSFQSSDRGTIRGNTIQGNQGSSVEFASSYGGGIHVYAAESLTLDANRVFSNTAYHGAGLYLSRSTTFTMTNSIVAYNRSYYNGGGMAFETEVNQPVTGTLDYNTFMANDLGIGDGRIAIHVNDPYVDLQLRNNLIYSHTYGVYVEADSSVELLNTFFYANSDGDTGGGGTIVNTTDHTGMDPKLTSDGHLNCTSPAIDIGLMLPSITEDIDGDTRPQGEEYDIGADEFSGTCSLYLPILYKGSP